MRLPCAHTVVQSAGFSAAPVFVVAALWFASVAFAALLYCCCRCCCCAGGNISDSYSRKVFAITLALLLVATAAAVVGCAVLYDGQVKFYGSTTATLDYVVSQSGEASATLRNFTALLETAKAAGVGGATLPANLARSVDDVAGRVDAAADELASRTADNSRRIRSALETMYVMTHSPAPPAAYCFLIDRAAVACVHSGVSRMDHNHSHTNPVRYLPCPAQWQLTATIPVLWPQHFPR
ncbi:hypothetical protein EJB05_41716, partial [Eragrostis curvula]